ncbi:hypothetical protein ACTFIW_001886 [Dictyostelium discoideum]
MKIINSFLITLIFVQLILQINGINESLFKNYQNRQVRKSNSENDIPLYFSVLPFAKGNYSCSFGGIYGIGFLGLINQCVNDPYNPEYNYYIFLQDEGSDDEQIVYQLHNKTDTDCTGEPPFSNYHFINREGTCDAAPNFIGLEDQIVGLYNENNGQRYLYDEPAFITVADMPYSAHNSVFFALYNQSYCSSQAEYPHYAKVFSIGLQMLTQEGVTYFYSCDPHTYLPQITVCKSKDNCETKALDNSCSLVDGTEDVYQQIFCSPTFQ